MQIRSAVAHYRSLGWSPVILAPNAKRPLAGKWPDLSPTPDEFTERHNVGVQLGQPSGGLLDFDFDQPQSCTIGHALAAPSWLRIKRGNSITHVLVVVSDPPDGFNRRPLMDAPEVAADGKRKQIPLVDLRFSRHQTMLPPSKHPDGIHPTWVTLPESPLPTTAFRTAMAFGETVAQLSRVARRWGAGARHDASIALAGWLYHCGVSKDHALIYFRAVLLAAGDDEPNDRLAAFRSTWSRAEGGSPVQGIKRLRELLGDEVLDTALSTTPLTTKPARSAGGAPPPEANATSRAFFASGAAGNEASGQPPASTAAAASSEDVEHTGSRFEAATGDSEALDEGESVQSSGFSTEDEDLPAAVAIARRAIDRLRGEQERLVWWDEDFWEPHLGAWRRVDRGRLRSKLRRDFAPNASPTTLGHTLSVLEDLLQIGRRLILPDPPPVDLRTGASLPNPPYIVFNNGTMDASMSLKPHDRTHFHVIRSPLDYPDPLPSDLAEHTPQWDKALGDWFGDDTASMLALMEWFGYVLMGDNSMERIAALVGPPKSGKSTATNVLTSLLDEQSVIQSSLQALTGAFGLQSWPGAALAVLSESEKPSRRDDIALARARVLSISGRDAVEVQRKGRASTSTRLSARLMLVSNKMPDIGDATGAFARRLLLIPFSRPVSAVNHHLLADLQAELPYIAALAIQYYQAMKQRGDFSMAATTKEQLDLELAEASPIRAWADANLLFDPLSSAGSQELADDYNAWAKTNGDIEVSTRRWSRLFRDTFGLTKSRTGQGIVWQGVRLNDFS